MECPACGSKNSDHAVSCSSCGTSLIQNPTYVPKIEQQQATPSNLQSFKEQFISSNQTNFNSSPLQPNNFNPSNTEQRNDSFVPINPQPHNFVRTPPKPKSKLGSVIFFATSLVTVITLGFLSLFLILEGDNYVNKYVCSTYYENMPPKEMVFNITFELKDDQNYLFDIDENNHIDGTYELIESVEEDGVPAYTFNMNAKNRIINGTKENGEYINQFKLTIKEEEAYLKNLSTDGLYLCKITE